MASRREFLQGAAATGAAAAIFPPAAFAQQAMAQTVLGPLDVSKLGVTLPHEHIADGPYYGNKWRAVSRAEFTTRAVETLKQARAAGIETIVDLTTYDVGRDIRFLEEVSRRSGIHMIAATGQRSGTPSSPRVTVPSKQWP